ncbi:TrmH family RNA methyltransferase [Pseudonocardia sp. HH130630-07]|uniref:TrmH family RNA methyltransferase n=1 Tax=Pseudonocardia sp. HH130630-07 TaxID=1690815 RepID=UPI000814F88C|nr:RNA methyltransferase [Pseudonocardia sp. HH130630-07]ANY08782.1 RNA methyltransferase [Pseudonocardia sp. HH130630-07]
MTPGTTETPGTERSPRVAAARKLLRRAGRDRAGRFLVEGAQAVREALAAARVHELFVTDAAAERNAELVARARERGVRTLTVTDRAAATLSETVTPQGLVAVCDLVDVPVDRALAGAPGFVTVCAGIADPGNLGTVVRVADAAGCDAVLLAGDTVDPHNGKAVRASTGSVFHLPIARGRDAARVVGTCRAAGLTTLVADGRGELDLHDPAAAPLLAGPVAWILGSEAHGPGPEVYAAADHRVRVPIHGGAESLNLATAAAICLYATVAARAGIAPGRSPATG